MHAPLWGPPRVDPEFDEYRRREGRKAYVRARVRSVLRAGNGAPPEGSWIDGPDCPAPSEDELDSLKDPKARPAEPNQKLSVEEAFGLAARALENVKTLHATCVDPEKMQSKCISKLVEVTCWYGRTDKSARLSWPTTNLDPNKQVHGKTNKDVSYWPPVASYDPCCGFRNKGVDSIGYDLGHTSEFYALRLTIRNHFLPRENNLWRSEKRHIRGSKGLSRYCVAEAGSSHCYCTPHTYDKDSAEQWRMSALALTSSKELSKEAYRKAQELESQEYFFLANNGLPTRQDSTQFYPSPQNPHFEIRFRGDVYHIWKSHIPYPEAFSQSPYFQDDVFTFPSSFSRDDFLVFYQFLLRKGYAPDMCHTLLETGSASLAASFLTIHDVEGPPYILSQDVASPAFMLNCLAAYNLAITLRYEAMATDALQKLNSLPFTFEDPILILQRIYPLEPAASPPPEIRNWVRRWLSIQLLTLFGSYATNYMTNLGVLEKHPEIAPRFWQLMDGSCDLKADVSRVQRHFPISRGPQDLQARLASEGVIQLTKRTFPQNSFPVAHNGYYDDIATQRYPAVSDSTTLPWTVNHSPQGINQSRETLSSSSETQQRLSDDRYRTILEKLGRMKIGPNEYWAVR